MTLPDHAAGQALARQLAKSAPSVSALESLIEAEISATEETKSLLAEASERRAIFKQSVDTARANYDAARRCRTSQSASLKSQNERNPKILKSPNPEIQDLRLVSAAASDLAGRRIVKIVSTYGSLVTEIVPPWRSTIALTIDRPRPLPSRVAARAESTL